MLIALSLLFACGPSDTPEDAGPVDHRQDYPAPPEGGVGFATPDYEVPPYTDQQMCTVFTYDGPTVGVSGGQFYQDPQFGHHVVILVSNERESEVPDGTTWDCTETGNLRMENTDPLIFAGGDVIDGEGTPELVLPEGMATKLREGTRILVQSHHINYTEDAILVNDAINLELIPEDEVEVWAAPWIHVETDLDLPPGESSRTIDCAFEQDLNLLSMLGHMHEWGTAFSIEHIRPDGSSERLYDIPEWDPLYRDVPPQYNWAPGEFSVSAGDRFVTTCSWYNDTPDNLGFPEEMCVSVGMAYPAVVPVICEPD